MEEKVPLCLRLWQRLHIDFLLFIGLAAITAYGMLVLYSASGASEVMFQNRIIQVILGFAVMMIMAQLPPKFYQRLAPYLYLVGFIMLILVDAIGTTSKGAQRWLDLGFIRFQPSEIVKLAVPLMVAVYLGNRPLPPKMSETFIAIAMIIVPTLLVAIQPDLGTSILVSASGLFVVFLAGMSWWLILAAVVGLAAFIPIMWMYLMHDYQRMRVLTLLDPEKDPLGAGYHILQSKIAIGSGGISEEHGMVGFLILMAIYLFIIIRGLIIAVNAETSFGRILAGATTLIFFVYVFVNIGMVSGILPVVGVPLPLFSYGGTSYVAIMASFGLVMSIHTHKPRFMKGN